MKKLTEIAAAALMSATVAGGLAVPSAASAQVTIRLGEPRFWTPERTRTIRTQIWELERDIDRAVRRGTIGNREAFGLRRDLNFVRNWYMTSARNGLTYQEVRYLQDRVNRIRDRLRLQRYGWDRQDYWRDGNRNWRDQDRDGVPNRWDRDRDGDGVRDRWERDHDRDGIYDDADPDDDNDGILDPNDPNPFRRY